MTSHVVFSAIDPVAPAPLSTAIVGCVIRDSMGFRGLLMNAEDFQFEGELPERATDEPALVVDVEGFEGPLDLLLTLARQQKVDLAKISILALADQYLAFIDAARKLRLELAADYLVMAAWLAYLKSRLLLPEQHAPGGSERRRHGKRAGARAAPAKNNPQCRREFAQPTAPRPRGFPARRARAD